MVRTLVGDAGIDVVAHATTLAGAPLVHHTGRTEALPFNGNTAGSTTHAERARAMGGALLADGTPNPTASYPVLDGAPVGRPEGLRAVMRRAVARAMAERAAHAPGQRGLPGSKRERRAMRAAKHNAKGRTNGD